MRWTSPMFIVPLLIVLLVLAVSGCTMVQPRGLAPSSGTMSLQGTPAADLQPPGNGAVSPTGGVANHTVPPVPPATASQTLTVPVPDGTASASPSLTQAVAPAGIQEVLLLPSDTVVAGQEVEARASTILSPGNRILVEVTTAAFGPTSKTAPLPEGGVSGVVTVEQGPGGGNSWSFRFSTAGFPPGLYIVTIAGIEVERYKGSSTLTILPAPVTGTRTTAIQATGTVTSGT